MLSKYRLLLKVHHCCFHVCCIQQLYEYLCFTNVPTLAPTSRIDRYLQLLLLSPNQLFTVFIREFLPIVFATVKTDYSSMAIHLSLSRRILGVYLHLSLSLPIVQLLITTEIPTLTYINDLPLWCVFCLQVSIVYHNFCCFESFQIETINWFLILTLAAKYFSLSIFCEFQKSRKNVQVSLCWNGIIFGHFEYNFVLHQSIGEMSML